MATLEGCVEGSWLDVWEIWLVIGMCLGLGRMLMVWRLVVMQWKSGGDSRRSGPMGGYCGTHVSWIPSNLP